MKKFISIFLVLFVSYITYSQTNEDEILKDNDFKILTEKSIKFYTSEEYINFEKIRKELLEETGRSFYPHGLLTPTEYKMWMEKNLTKTKFTSLEEAMLAYEKHYDTGKEIDGWYGKLEDKYGSESFFPVYRKHILSKFKPVLKANGIFGDPPPAAFFEKNANSNAE
ncbi:hypothetical protein NU10_01965 [Flavobacterium dauae]|uniref:hypothetical protein n=1 Tax=Flavobacterium dauae TaxID=1563479 RepID=UPI00101B2A30|nr:hypothetical protein [Flavobacterium dauae]WLD24188.1 hypothetical protein NU10_01965 [Flavobacterium dauae]